MAGVVAAASYDEEDTPLIYTHSLALVEKALRAGYRLHPYQYSGL